MHELESCVSSTWRIIFKLIIFVSITGEERQLAVSLSSN